MSDQDRLRGYVDVWWQAVDDFVNLLEEIPADQWQAPTDLPGWNVHDIAAHTAHLEAVSAGADHDNVEIGQPAHVTGIMGQFTEQGVVARKDRDPDELVREIRESTTRRHTWLLEHIPEDPDATADGFAAFVGWTWERLLRNRPLDVWMHDQDIRRATGRPGDMDSPAAKHTADYLVESLGYVVGKRAGAPAGTTVVLEVEGSDPAAVQVNDDGRARSVEQPAEPTVRMALSREEFIVMAGGRRTPQGVAIEGDESLGQAVLANYFSVTP